MVTLKNSLALLFALLTLSSCQPEKSAVAPVPQALESKRERELRAKKAELMLSLTTSEREYQVGQNIEIGFRVKNISDHTIVLPHFLINHATLFVELFDDRGNRVRFKNDDLIKDVGPLMDAKTKKPIVYVTTLSPNEYWGSDTKLQNYGLSTYAAGRYKAHVIAQFTDFEKVFPPGTWIGQVEADIDFTVVRR